MVQLSVHTICATKKIIIYIKYHIHTHNMYIDTKTVFLSNHVGTPVGLGHLSFTAVQHVTLENCTLAINFISLLS